MRKFGNHHATFGMLLLQIQDVLSVTAHYTVPTLTTIDLYKANKEDNDCCYYLHCPNLNYTVVPSTDNDEKNAIDYTQTYKVRKSYPPISTKITSSGMQVWPPLS